MLYAQVEIDLRLRILEPIRLSIEFERFNSEAPAEATKRNLRLGLHYETLRTPRRETINKRGEGGVRTSAETLGPFAKQTAGTVLARSAWRWRKYFSRRASPP